MQYCASCFCTIRSKNFFELFDTVCIRYCTKGLWTPLYPTKKMYDILDNLESDGFIVTHETSDRIWVKPLGTSDEGFKVYRVCIC